MATCADGTAILLKGSRSTSIHRQWSNGSRIPHMVRELLLMGLLMEDLAGSLTRATAETTVPVTYNGGHQTGATTAIR